MKVYSNRQYEICLALLKVALTEATKDSDKTSDYECGIMNDAALTEVDVFRKVYFYDRFMQEAKLLFREAVAEEQAAISLCAIKGEDMAESVNDCLKRIKAKYFDGCVKLMQQLQQDNKLHEEIVSGCRQVLQTKQTFSLLRLQRPCMRSILQPTPQKETQRTLDNYDGYSSDKTELYTD